MTGSGETDEDLALSYAIGLLEGDVYEQMAQRVPREPALGAEVERLEALLAPIALHAPSVPTTDSFFDRLEERIDQDQAEKPACSVIRAGAVSWEELGSGVRIKVLNRMATIHRQTFLLELAPGAIAHTHGHEDDEECYVLSGDIWFGDSRLEAGDYHLAPKKAWHGTVRSVSGCLCLIIASTA